MLASMFAAIGGILLASRLQAVGQSTGGSDFLLLAIAGPVVAGVSLFGGRGTVWAALLGALVMGSISNGMDLLALEPSTKNIITGGGASCRRRPRCGHEQARGPRSASEVGAPTLLA